MNTKEFIVYFKSFYKNNPKALYPNMINAGWNDKDVEKCIDLRGDQFAGDSFDREAIRDMLIANFGPRKG